MNEAEPLLTIDPDGPLFRMPPYTSKVSEAVCPDGTLPCLRCGRPVTAKGHWQVEVVDGGDTLCTPGDGNPEHPGYMGYYPLGEECARLIPTPFKERSDPGEA